MCPGVWGDKMVAHYACAEKPHAEGGVHYHVTIKLNKPKRWYAPREYIRKAGAEVNFREPPNAAGMYAWMYRYICKYLFVLFLTIVLFSVPTHP